MKKRNSLLVRILLAATTGIGLALWLSFPANSLTVTEADRTTALLAELSAELGEFAYDEEEANRIFDEDEAWNGRIKAAGYSREQWQKSVDAAFRGFLATIPEDVVDAQVRTLFERLDTMASLTSEQKAEIRAATDDKIKEIYSLRAEGEDYADVMRPFAKRMEIAFRTGLSPDQ